MADWLALGFDSVNKSIDRIEEMSQAASGYDVSVADVLKNLAYWQAKHQ